MKNTYKIGFSRFLLGMFLINSLYASAEVHKGLLNKNNYYSVYKSFIPNHLIQTNEEFGQKKKSHFLSVENSSHVLLKKLGDFQHHNVVKAEQLKPFSVGGYGVFQEVNKKNQDSPTIDSADYLDSCRAFTEKDLIKSIVKGGVKNGTSSNDISAQTVAGRAFLLDILSNPPSDIKEISKRRESIKKLRKMHPQTIEEDQKQCVDLEASCSFDPKELKKFYDQHWFSPSQYADSKWLAPMVSMRVLRSLYVNHEAPINELTSVGFRTTTGGLLAGAEIPSKMPWLESGKLFGGALFSSLKRSAYDVFNPLLDFYGVTGWPYLAQGRWFVGGVLTASPLLNFLAAPIIRTVAYNAAAIKDSFKDGHKKDFSKYYKQAKIETDKAIDKAIRDKVRLSVSMGMGKPNEAISTHLDGYEFTKLGESDRHIVEYLEKLRGAKKLWTNISFVLDVAEGEKSGINAFFEELESIFTTATWVTCSQRLIQLFWKAMGKPVEQNPLQQFWVLIGKYDALCSLARYFNRLELEELKVCEVEFDEKSEAPRIEIEGAYHPLMAAQQLENDLPVTTNNFEFNEKNRNNTIISPNGAGKSVLLGTLFNVVEFAQGTGYTFGKKATMTLFKGGIHGNKNIDEKMQQGDSTGRVQVNSLGGLVDDIKSAAKKNEKMLLFVDEPAAGLPKAGAEKILFSKEGLIESCENNKNVMLFMVTHFDLREDLKKSTSFNYMNLKVNETNQNESKENKFENTYTLEKGEGWWMSDSEKRKRFVTCFMKKLKKDAKKNTKIQEIYNENDGNLLYPEFEAMAYEDLPTLASADTDVVRFMHAFKRSTVVPLDQLKKINVIGEEGSLFHEIAGDKRERLETLMGALKLSEWLVSPGTTKVEIERRQSLVEQLRGKENLERKTKVKALLTQFKNVEQKIAHESVSVKEQSKLYQDISFSVFNDKIDMRNYISGRSAITSWRAFTLVKGFGAYILMPIVAAVTNAILTQTLFSGERVWNRWTQGRQLQLSPESRLWLKGVAEGFTPKSLLGPISFKQFAGQLTGYNAIRALYNKDYKAGLFSAFGTLGAYGLTYLAYKSLRNNYAGSDVGQGDAKFLPYFDTIEKGRELFKKASHEFKNKDTLCLDAEFEKTFDAAKQSSSLFQSADKIEQIVRYCGYELEELCRFDGYLVCKSRERKLTTYKATLPVHDLFNQMGELDAACAFAEWLDILDGKGFPVYKASFVDEKDAQNGAQLTMEGAIHPLMPGYKKYISQKVVQNDIKLDAENCRNNLITAPNSSGKSVVIQNALNIILAQSTGYSLSKTYRAVIYHKILFNKRIDDDMSKGDSTGTAQAGSILELANLVGWAGKYHKNVFLGCDEFLSGTQEDVAKYLLFDKKVLGLLVKMNECPRVVSMLATHFDLGAALKENNLNSFKCKHMDVKYKKANGVFTIPSDAYTFTRTFKLKDGPGFWLEPENKEVVDAYMAQYYDECLPVDKRTGTKLIQNEA
ncbi:MAG: hypothetical protein UV38_C0001G0006 [candidate division TM6 bacterium GW2011_GWE2_42_60]|nr:MAG: hypothetical protein UV38_C0001G0006 [candidate division TM6 bacterium GW2011_GWE2_42_60]HBY05798.1 hypothetical protein [Candidatus Dependentiae bacterium]